MSKKPLRSVILCSLFIAAASSYANSLKNHVSPYLAMHGNDPVDWHEWNADTVTLAKKQNKLIFVSSGYFSCHWCHVMQRESYQNKDIAALLNKNFIPVKVDRELDAALDAHLIDFVERTQGISGWPLNVFVTPDGYPLVGMVYVPADNFKQILQKLSAQWNKDAATLNRIGQKAYEELSSAVTSQSTKLPGDLGSNLLKAFTQQTMSYADTLQGGFGQENKFPSVPQLLLALDSYQLAPDEELKKFLIVTLDQMATQGLRDQLGGGFYRYVVDPGWQVPHFEKMLYDNALLASLYYRAAEVFKAEHYNAVASETLDFILSELATMTPAYAASLSAVDDKGVEGGYYLWHETELKKILTPDELAVIKLFWQIDAAPDLDDGHHLVLSANYPIIAERLKLDQKQVASTIASAANKMRATRSKRVLPKDNKILTAWNGLTLTALVQGATRTDNAQYRQKAEALAGFIHNTLWDQRNKLLRKASTGSGALGEGALEDYAYTAQGLYELWVLTGDAQTKTLLQDIIAQAWQRFYGKQGWLLAQNMLLKYDTGKTVLSDGPMPSAAAILIHTSYQFAQRDNDQVLKAMALRAMNVGHDEVEKDAFWFATQISAINIASNKSQ